MVHHVHKYTLKRPSVNFIFARNIFSGFGEYLMRNIDKIFIRKPEGKRTCGRSKRRWEDNIRMDLEEIG
jgi:hypothetical protein